MQPALVTCAGRSVADFPGAFRDRRNLVSGPLAMMGGGAFTDAATVRRFGGNKFPLLVRAGHTVTVTIAPASRRLAALGYGPAPQGRELVLRDAHRAITFVACPRGKSGGSSADGEPVTFWSGFVLAGAPACVGLDVVADGRPRRRVRLALGRRCEAPPPLRGCATRAESGRQEDGRARPGEIGVGPLRFAGLARLASRRELRLGRSSGRYRVKAGLLLPAGIRATLSIGREARGWAALAYAPRPDADGDRAVRLQACAADEPAFSHEGTVGPITGFAGGFVLTRPGCVPLEVRLPGRPVVRRRVSFGAGRCR